MIGICQKVMIGDYALLNVINIENSKSF